MKYGVKWLDRDLVKGPYLGLATSDAMFRKAVRHLKVPRDRWPTWLAEDCMGCAHTFTTPSGSIACIVCVRPGEQQGIEAASTIIHEAVHVWQAWRRHIGENDPSREFEAYAIEAICKRLLKAYADALSQ